MDARQQHAETTGLPPEADVSGRVAFAVMRCLVAAILVLAAVLKWRELATTPPVHWGAVGPVPLLLTQIGCETMLAIWLASGLLPRTAWITTAVAFTGFLAISMWKAVRGEVSCGCFGSLAINPWYTAGLDAAVLAGLYWVRKQAWRQRGNSVAGYWIAGALMLAVGGTLTMVWLKRPVFANLENTGGLPAEGRIVYFKASEWVGKRLPLLAQIDIGDRLSKGRWILVIHNSQCKRCRQVVPEYQQLSAQWGERSNGLGVALVDVVSATSPGNDEIADRAPALVGHVVSQRNWFIVTPAILAMENGTVLAANDEEPAAPWIARVFKER